MKMQNIIKAFVLGTIFMLPLSASAMFPLTENELSAVRGAGQPVVSIDVGTGGTETATALLKSLVDTSQVNPVNKSDLSVNTFKRTAGVSIFFDVTLNLHFDVIAWGDSDGFGASGASQAGYVGLSNVNVSGLHIGPRNDLGRK